MGAGQGGLSKLDDEHGEAEDSDNKAGRTKDLPSIEPV